MSLPVIFLKGPANHAAFTPAPAFPQASPPAAAPASVAKISITTPQQLSSDEQKWYKEIRDKIQARRPGQAVIVEQSPLTTESSLRVLDLLLLGEIQAYAYYHNPSPPFYCHGFPLHATDFILNVSGRDSFDERLLRSTWTTRNDVLNEKKAEMKAQTPTVGH